MKTFKEFLNEGLTGINLNTEETELYLYITTDGKIYNSNRMKSIRANLEKKYKKGVFDKNKAWKIFVPVVDEAAKSYARDFGGVDDVKLIFSRKNKDNVAKQMAENWINEAKLGNF